MDCWRCAESAASSCGDLAAEAEAVLDDFAQKGERRWSLFESLPPPPTAPPPSPAPPCCCFLPFATPPGEG